jgi:hypothetical protein
MIEPGQRLADRPAGYLRNLWWCRFLDFVEQNAHPEI